MADEGGDLDSWEDQADSGLLDQRLDAMTIEIQQAEEKKKLASKPQVVTEDSQHTPYQPQVRILRRDASSSPITGDKKSPNSGSQGASKHTKSLQQREAEYAEARMRIFGSLPPASDEENGADEDEEVTGGEGTCFGSKTENGNCADSSVIKKSIPQNLRGAGEGCDTPVSVLRQPKGPDGTTGFNKPDHT